MSLLGILEIEMTIQGRKFTHTMTVVEDINYNILGTTTPLQNKSHLLTC